MGRVSMYPCRVCGKDIEDGQMAFDPASDYSYWPLVNVPFIIHKDCVPQACRSLAVDYAKSLSESR